MSVGRVSQQEIQSNVNTADVSVTVWFYLYSYARQMDVRDQQNTTSLAQKVVKWFSRYFDLYEIRSWLITGSIPDTERDALPQNLSSLLGRADEPFNVKISI